jgi:DNA-binding transcriptional ArsR family regulator
MTLSNELRLSLIEELKTGPKSVGELSTKIGAEQSKVSHALQQLKSCGFVISSNKGKERIYSLSGSLFTKLKKNKNLFEMLDEHYTNVCKGHCHKNREDA